MARYLNRAAAHYGKITSRYSCAAMTRTPGCPLLMTDHERKYIQLMPDKGRFLVFTNGGFAAEVELMETEWEITSGDLFDSGLERQVLRRIIHLAS
ncbi:hypothetical protein [Mucilaginibacter sp. L3T2-6]|uniref:hypothetical protein n=1 Tax=Mucilaginibacter sp. L3T2-6 TaxID=3062491 RepID=UPI002675EA0E|nr:hypothetical protein [Mucilaginibacter sp. L3T2-6]MDO3641290.1 hypothetical protein [Mucilaginibacter sp. L3T2-6]MDV6213950.1 hypothetical protein [Mucilaginibacter sp. L3T2-6]